jgi:hypothetical protein
MGEREKGKEISNVMPPNPEGYYIDLTASFLVANTVEVIYKLAIVANVRNSLSFGANLEQPLQARFLYFTQDGGKT